MIRLDLEGCFVARFEHDGQTHSVNIRRGGPICEAAQLMLAVGVEPTAEVEVWRGDTAVFVANKTVAWWAMRTVEECGRRGPRIRLRSDVGGALSGADPSQGGNVPDEACRTARGSRERFAPHSGQASDQSKMEATS